MPTKIEWTDETWNPITGCTPISEGCQHCYARRMARRLAGRYGYPESPHEFDVTFHPDKLDEPLCWKNPRRVFVCSMGDLFHEDVQDKWILDVWSRMLECPHHIFQILTKRPGRMRWFVNLFYGETEVVSVPPPDNIWIGVTVENQEQADKRIPILLDIPAAVRFVSIEPMLSSVDLENYLWQWEQVGFGPGPDDWDYDIFPADPGIDWVIVGGETGPGARPMHPDWVRSVRDQCVDAGVPFFFKTWGDLGYWEHTTRTEGFCTFPIWKSTNGKERVQNPWDLYGGWQYDNCHRIEPELYSERMGKQRAGRLLDGQGWNEYPETRC